MPRLALAVVVAATVVFLGGLVRAETSDGPWTPTKAPTEETIYATDHHMGFSLRSAFITWLGGVAISDERDVRASEREKWWGEAIPRVPADLFPTAR
jgi:hypothetical protein